MKKKTKQKPKAEKQTAIQPGTAWRAASLGPVTGLTVNDPLTLMTKLRDAAQGELALVKEENKRLTRLVERTIAEDGAELATRIERIHQSDPSPTKIEQIRIPMNFGPSRSASSLPQGPGFIAKHPWYERRNACIAIMMAAATLGFILGNVFRSEMKWP